VNHETPKLLDGRSPQVAGWQLFAWVVFGLIVVHSVYCSAHIALLVEDRRLIDQLRAGRDDMTVEQIRSHRHTLNAVSNLDLVPTFLVLVGVLVWFTLLSKAIKAAADVGTAATSPWIYRAFWAAVFVWALFGTAAALAAPDLTDLAAAAEFDKWQIRRAVARLAVAGFLLLAVLVIRTRTTRITAL
jgi:hypothetical protein